MIQIYNPTHVFWSRILSRLISPLYLFCNLFRKSELLDSDKIKSIFVLQYHRIGDVILIAPILKSLKNKFPRAKITLLCCQQAVLLAENLHLADEVIGVTVPWTNWDWSIAKWIGARSFSRNFRERNIDIAIDFKGDLRDSWFLWNLKSKMSLGYTDTGGAFFYTHSNSSPTDAHQTLRAFNLIEKLGCKSIIMEENKMEYNATGTIVFHAGGTDPKRSWPEKHWLELAESLSRTHKVSVVKTNETRGLIQRMKEKGLTVEVFSGDLVEFKNWLMSQKLLIAIDSMPGHLAAYLKIPVISIFGAQSPDWTRPLGKYVSIVRPNDICNHVRDHWRLCSQCMASVQVEKVLSEVTKLISRVQNGG